MAPMSSELALQPGLLLFCENDSACKQVLRLEVYLRLRKYTTQNAGCETHVYASYS